MFDLGRSFLASVERSPDALAIVDGAGGSAMRNGIARSRRASPGFDDLGLKPGDHLLGACRTAARWRRLHWACQLAGVIMTPLNWRAKADELDYCVDDCRGARHRLPGRDRRSGARARARRSAAAHRARRAAGHDRLRRRWASGDAAMPRPRAGRRRCLADALHVGHHRQPKGVPRRHRQERAAALAHVAQNLYGRGERTLGVMPLYHTMGVRSLLAMALVDGCFVCLPRFDVAGALALIEASASPTSISCRRSTTISSATSASPSTDISSVRKLGFAGAAMPDGLLKRVAAAFKPELFVNHYGSSEIYTFTIEPDAAAKPGSAGGRASTSASAWCSSAPRSRRHRRASARKAKSSPMLRGDEAFEGYWRRPDADAKALQGGWYFTGDTGYRDAAAISSSPAGSTT